MPDADDVAAEQGGRAGVVGVVVRVDQVGHRVGRRRRRRRSRPRPAAGCGRWSAERRTARRRPGRQERRLVDAVGDPVQVPLDPADVVPLVVEGRAERGPGDRRVVGQVCGAVDSEAGEVTVSPWNLGHVPGGRASLRDRPRLAARQVRGRHRSR